MSQCMAWRALFVDNDGLETNAGGAAGWAGQGKAKEE
jgi:hypothetical protein